MSITDVRAWRLSCDNCARLVGQHFDTAAAAQAYGLERAWRLIDVASSERGTQLTATCPACLGGERVDSGRAYRERKGNR